MLFAVTKLGEVATLAAGESEEVALRWSHPWTPWATAVVMVAVAIYIGFLYHRERSTGGRVSKVLLGTIRVGLFALVMFMLYRLVIESFRTELPDLVIAIDESQSMTIEDQYDDQLASRIGEQLDKNGLNSNTRLNLTKSLLLDDDRQLLRSLAKNHRLRLFRMGSSARPFEQQELPSEETIRDLKAELPSSRLGQSLRDIFAAQRGRPTAGIVFITDGIVTSGPSIGDVASLARQREFRLYPIGVGDSRPAQDLQLTDLLVSDTVFVGDLVTADFKILATGYPDSELELRLLSQKDSRLLASKQITSPTDSVSFSERLSFRADEKGDHEIVVEIVPHADELQTENNSLSRTIHVRDDSIRVLLVQFDPSWEFRALKNLLSRQLKPAAAGEDLGAKAFEVVSILQDADPEYADTDATAERALPISREELFRYDVIVFGDVDPALLSKSAIDDISAFVSQRGGGLIVISGPKFTPHRYEKTALAGLLPVRLETLTAADPAQPIIDSWPAQLSALGRSSGHLQLADDASENERLWQSLPQLRWLLAAEDWKPAARTFIEHPTRKDSRGRNLPVVAMQYVGRGKVLFHATDELWRWQATDEGRAYSRYWIQSLRLLSRAKLLGASRGVELTTDGTRYKLGESVQLRARFLDERLAPTRNDGVTVTVDRQGGRRRQITLQRMGSRDLFEATVADLTEGAYSAWLSTPLVEGDTRVQQFQVVAPPGESTETVMDEQALREAAEKSGGKYFSWDEAADLADHLPAAKQVRVEVLDQVPLWNAHWLAGLFIVLIVTEWLLRKRWGML